MRRALRLLAAQAMILSKLIRGLVALPLFASACGGDAAPTEGVAADADDVVTGEGDNGKEDSTFASEPGIRVVVTVDWEGTDLSSANLAAMEAFRTQFPKVPLVQFLNAAYYTKAGASAAAVTRSIRRAVRAGDELGLHIHGWKRLFEAADVTFRAEPTFWGSPLDASECLTDCGHEVAISSYSRAELRKVIDYSIATLQRNGFGHATSFRAGGWMAGATVRGALLDSGLTVDHSAVPSSPLSGELRGLPLLDWVKTLWPRTSATTQPYSIAVGSGSLVEIPDNGALADYVTTAEMVAVFDSAVTAYKHDRSHAQVVSIGFHQETAADYASRVQRALVTIASHARTAKVAVHYVTSAGAIAP